jgi:inhibitor of cysteine peptidase
MKNMKITLIFMLLGSLLLAACQPADQNGTLPVENGYAYGQEAVVESVEVLLMESFPLQANAVVSGYYPDGCVELDEISVEHDDMEFILTLTTRRLTGDVVCTEALVYFEESVSLEIAGLEAGTYTVIAQDQQAQFTLDVDNVLEMEPVTGGEGVLIGSDAVAESMSVMIMESYPVQVSVELSGYLPDGCTTIREVGSSRNGDTFTIQIATQRPDGDVACTMALVPFNERVDLEVEGLPAGEYTVRYGELSETFTLDADN